MPASDGDRIGFEGRRKFAKLVEMSDRCEIDDFLISLLCAGEILTGNKQADGKVKLDLAASRLAQLKSKASGKERIRIGLSPENDGYRHGLQLRAVYARNP